MYVKLKVLFDIRIIYSIVFSTLVLWALFAYYTMNKLIKEQQVYAELINLSGKQRMLSQKTTLIAKRYFETKEDFLKIHLNELIKLMKSDHEYIIKNLTSEKTNKIYLLNVNNLDTEVKSFITLLNNFYKNNNKSNLTKLENFSFKLLPKLNFAVNIFEQESDEVTQNLLYREYFILIGTLLTLLLEAIFIVIPSIKRAKEKEEELQKLNEQLEIKIEKAIKSNQQKEDILKQQFKLAQMGEMMRNIAHHYRQPLSVISSLASGMKMEKKFDILDENKLETNLNIILDKTNYLSSVLDDFDNYVKDEENDINPFCVKKAIEQTLSIQGLSFKNKNITINTNYPQNNINIIGNDVKFKHVILNILNNAKDAVKKYNKGEINISIKEEIKNIKIIIFNVGDPINESIKDKIFDIYFTTKHQSLGTGLGLFISHEIITKTFKGSLTCKNHNNGVSFIINLPKVN